MGDEESGNFSDQTINVCGRRFARCRFVNCTLVFDASAPVYMVACNYDHVNWHFAGPAGNTLSLLRSFAGDESPWRDLVRQWLLEPASRSHVTLQ